MAERVQLGAKVHPQVKGVLRKRADTLEVSIGYIVEMMTAEMFKSELPGFLPGKMVTGDDK